VGGERPDGQKVTERSHEEVNLRFHSLLADLADEYKEKEADGYIPRVTAQSIASSLLYVRLFADRQQ
jgi:hypothetical protein